MNLFRITNSICTFKLCFAAVAVMAFFPHTAFAQLQLTPTALFMDETSQTGRVMIRNNASEPVEIEVEFLFGYPETNEEGNIYLKSFEGSVPEELPSALEWVRAYPRHFVLNGNERQTIRFAARPPAGLQQGEYWVRPVITNYAPGINVNTTAGSRVSAQLNIRRRNILSLHYRNGMVQAGVDISRFKAVHRDGVLEVSADMERTGNAAWLGDAQIIVFGPGGEQVLSTTKRMAVYLTQQRVFRIEMENAIPGNHTVELILSTKDRTDEKYIQAQDKSARVNFTVQ